MASRSDLLGRLDGGRVLDVGTGRGSFIRTLIDELRSYTEIIGLDASDADASAFADSFGAMPSVEFLQADAAEMPFADESFETVAIAGSLHHMANPEQVLMEMRRVLSSGGAFIVGEQFRDRLTRPETTHRLFHEWSEQVMAVAFRRTYRRAEIIDLVNWIELEGVQQIVVRDDSDPMDSTKIARWDGLIADFLDRVRGRADLVARGQTIRAQLREDGIRIGPALFTLGRKPQAGDACRPSVASIGSNSGERVRDRRRGPGLEGGPGLGDSIGLDDVPRGGRRLRGIPEGDLYCVESPASDLSRFERSGAL